MKYSKTQLILAGYVVLLLLSLLIAVCSEGPASATRLPLRSGASHHSDATPEGLPDLSQALPDIPRGMTMNMNGMEQHVLLTDKGFSSLNKRFGNFLGSEWEELKTGGNFKRGLEGLFPKEDLPEEIEQALFQHPDYPGTFIAISQMPDPTGGEQPLTMLMRFTP